MISDPEKSWTLCADTGGTFTDCIAFAPDGSVHRCKVLSSSTLKGRITTVHEDGSLSVRQEWGAPDNLPCGFRFEATDGDRCFTSRVRNFSSTSSRLVLEQPAPAELLNRTFELHTEEAAPLLGARILTGTPSGKPLPPLDLRLATTRGTNALLERKGARTAFLITEGFADLLRIGNQQRPDLFSLRIDKPAPFFDSVIEIPERIDARGSVVRSMDPDLCRNLLSGLPDRTKSVAICLLNSYRNPKHERMLETLLKEMGFEYISISSRLTPEINVLTRGRTADVNAYLAPVMDRYLRSIEEQAHARSFLVMTSTGGLTRADQYRPVDGLLSGPAGGVTGAAAAASAAGCERLLTFDMGGTSTDVSRYHRQPDYRRQQSVGDATIASPSIAIETVAAGGGSICGFDGRALTVGPDSAGADPGPACYGSGGPLTITDVNLLSGRLDPANFQLPVSVEAAESRLQEMTGKIRSFTGQTIKRHDLLQGYIDIANEKMAQAISGVSTAKGYDPAEHTLVAFGGAGGQHATSIAKSLGIRRILVPSESGLLSARGLHYATRSRLVTRQLLKPAESVETDLPDLFGELAESAVDELASEGVDRSTIEVKRRTLFLRLEGQESTLELEWQPKQKMSALFRKAYRESYGHWVEGRAVEVESIRLEAGESAPAIPRHDSLTDIPPPEPDNLRTLHIRDQPHKVPIFRRSSLRPGVRIPGPALILDSWTTLFIECDWNCQLRGDGTFDIRYTSQESNNLAKTPQLEAVQLQLYTNRFRSLAEEMGNMLRRTALSVNVKERLDFSYALLDRDGHLVVNAPHIPVHLGAMGHCVRELIRSVPIEPGDMIVTNHPGYGGSHLPDVTLVAPVFSQGERVAFVANRAHHSELGGKKPGSMPPDATRLTEEGVVLEPFHLIRKGEENWTELDRRLRSGPWPSRTPDENLADLQAAVAANHHGQKLFRELIADHGHAQVTRYMDRLRQYASDRMRQTLASIDDGLYTAREEMDDGTPLDVKFDLRGEQLAVDFSESGDVHPGNLNANPAIVQSVLIYLLRLLVDEPLPLNDGLFEPVHLVLPDGILNPPFPDDPAECPAVVGGNIETSQRLTDTCLKAFGLLGCSQGTMNNILFGNERFGYYETVGGGTGAGEGFDGADSVHHHMTNTRSTDPEILEHRYPVRLDRLAIRKGSGGRGRWNGGNGTIRLLTFLENVELSVLTQHRTVAPYGMAGGKPGSRGRQAVIRADGTRESLRWRDSADMSPGDRLLLETPGGGGYGQE